MNPAVPKRWERRKEARPAEIVAAALQLFSDRGFAATRLDDVATVAGVSKGTVYLYFESKEAMFKSLVRESVGNALTAASAGVAPLEGSSRALLTMVITTTSTVTMIVFR